MQLGERVQLIRRVKQLRLEPFQVGGGPLDRLGSHLLGRPFSVLRVALEEGRLKERRELVDQQIELLVDLYDRPR